MSTAVAHLPEYNRQFSSSIMINIKPIALLTMHEKELAVSAALLAAGFEVFTYDVFDTDTLGSFTGEIARKGTMLDAAKHKARLACELTGERYGLGSEGSFGGDPWLGISGWGREILVWHDAQDNVDVSAFVQGAQTNYATKTVQDLDQALAFAAQIRFPQHGIIIRQDATHFVDKECHNLDELQVHLIDKLVQGPVELSSDMRAHRNPQRMDMIRLCADELKNHLLSFCPVCKTAGFRQVGTVPGAICDCCGAPTQQARAALFECHSCHHRAEKFLRETINAQYCDFCNP